MFLCWLIKKLLLILVPYTCEYSINIGQSRWRQFSRTNKFSLQRIDRKPVLLWSTNSNPKCAKTHLRQSRVSKIFPGEDPPLNGREEGKGEKGGSWSGPPWLCKPSYGPVSVQWIVVIGNKRFIIYCFDVLQHNAFMFLWIGFLSAVGYFLVVAEEWGTSFLAWSWWLSIMFWLCSRRRCLFLCFWIDWQYKSMKLY